MSDERGYDTKGSRKALGAMNAKLKAKIGRLERELAAYQRAQQPQRAEAVPDGFRVMLPTSTILNEGDRWEIYAPCGSGGIVHEDDVTDWVVRKLLDALAAAPSAPKADDSDADNYRWLREQHNNVNSDIGVYNGVNILATQEGELDLDAAIAAARKGD